MTEKERKIGPLTVRGFKDASIKEWEPKFGKTVNEKQDGYLSLSVGDREKLNIDLGEIIEVTRGDIEIAMAQRLRVVPGVDGYVGVTGEARKQLGKLANEKKDKDPQPGDVVEITRKGLCLEITKVVQKKTRAIGTEPEITAVLDDNQNATNDEIIRAFNVFLSTKNPALIHRAFLAMILREEDENVRMVLVKAFIKKGGLSDSDRGDLISVVGKEKVKDCLRSLSDKGDKGARRELDNL